MRFAKELEAHADQCTRCQLKRSYDWEWERRVDDALAENKDVISKALGFSRQQEIAESSYLD